MKRTIWAVCLLLLLPAAGFSAEEAGKAAVFNHPGHLDNAPACGECHAKGDLTIVPPAERCDKCHDKGQAGRVTIPGPATHDSFWYRDHKSPARAEGSECAACHDDAFCADCHRAGFADQQGKVNIHRSDFRVTHPLLARADARSCRSCHDEGSCVDCHSRFAPADLAFESHRRSWSDLTVGGASHADFPPDSCAGCHPGSVLPTHLWSSAHAREARRSLPTCQSCHPDAEVCLRCHSAREGLIVNPHPRDWDDIKDILNGASGGKTCRRCH